MYKIVICDDDKNFIFYMKEMLLRCDLSERQVTFYEMCIRDRTKAIKP